jgi:hypothetical protein
MVNIQGLEKQLISVPLQRGFSSLFACQEFKGIGAKELYPLFIFDPDNQPG